MTVTPDGPQQHVRQPKVQYECAYRLEGHAQHPHSTSVWTCNFCDLPIYIDGHNNLYARRFIIKEMEEPW